MMINEMLGIKYPIFQGAMANIATAEFAAAVSNAGALGILGTGAMHAEEVRNAIHTLKSLTDKPFGVNIMLLSPYADEIASVVAEEGVSVVTTGAGNPAKYMDAWKRAGIKVIPVVASVAIAKLMERLGASAVIAEGGESGGHIGELTTIVLVPLIVSAVSIPVIAAGGIATGEQAAAAFMLGAVGVQMGTRFLTADECSVSETYKEKILKAGDRCTMVTGKRLGHPVRSLKTPFSRAYQKAEYSTMSDDELETFAVGALRKAVVDGDSEHGCFLSGQVAAFVNKREKAADIVKSIAEDTETCLRGAMKWVR